MSKEILSIYQKEIPDFLLPFLESPSMERIQHVGMHCGMEYTSFPFYKDLSEYSRYDHSLGVALILYHFSKEKKIALSGLFHDIATPCFAHVIDFLKGDHEKQEATEEKTGKIISSDSVIERNLSLLSIKENEVNNYHLYPLADNVSPKLSSDRLEYTLSNLYHYSFATLDMIISFFDDLMVDRNEEGEEEIVFLHREKAKEFALLTLKNSTVYTTDEDRYGMEYLARVLKKQIERKIISEDDLYLDEPRLIRNLLSDKESKKDWLSFRSLSHVHREETPSSIYSYKVPSKKRFIDPFVYHQDRISRLDEETKEAIEEFKKRAFDYYVYKD